jgi:hypothetical protein
MTGCLESGLSVARQELDRTIDTLAPSVEALLERLSPKAGVVTEVTDSGFRAEVPLSFPDGIGRGTVVAELFRYHDTVRFDVVVDHNRRFVLPESVVRSIVSGVHAARDGVARHNRLHQQPWHEVRIAAV